MTLGTEKLDVEEEQRHVLEVALMELRSGYKFCQAANDEKGLERILREVDRVKGELAKIPVRDSLRKMASVNEEFTRDDLTLLLLWVNEAVNVGQPMKEAQIMMLVDAILETAGFLRLEDVAIALREGVSGKYGKLYERVDVEVVLGWINGYTRDIQLARMQRETDMHLSRKESRVNYDAVVERNPVNIAKLAKDTMEVLKREPLRSDLL